MNDSEKQLVIGSAILSLIFDIPLITLLILWFIILICTIGNKETFINTLKATGLASIVWTVGIILAYIVCTPVQTY
nr:MAG TPA: hypothetical protein [Caudoviricetes sp.]